MYIHINKIYVCSQTLYLSDKTISVAVRRVHVPKNANNANSNKVAANITVMHLGRACQI